MPATSRGRPVLRSVVAFTRGVSIPLRAPARHSRRRLRPSQSPLGSIDPRALAVTVTSTPGQRVHAVCPRLHGANAKAVATSELRPELAGYVEELETAVVHQNVVGVSGKRNCQPVTELYRRDRDICRNLSRSR